jgi:hypothetical protein
MEESKENWTLEPGCAVPVQSGTALAVIDICRSGAVCFLIAGSPGI